MLPLIDLIRATTEKPDYPPAAAQLKITGLTADSRNVQPGDLFFALHGEKSNGEEFIPDAERLGAVAVVAPPPLGGRLGGGLIGESLSSLRPPPNLPPSGGGIALIHSHNPRLLMAQMAAKFFGRQPEHMAAVTGTDGKTSTADFFRQFWHHMGKDSASIGTLGILSGAGEELYPGSHTTPYPIQLHKILSELSSPPRPPAGGGDDLKYSPPQAGGMKGVVDYACMEASSHGLDQYRLDGVKLEAAAFTNLARDHLDYHKTEEAYFAAKLELFGRLLPEGKIAVLNQDDARFGAIKKTCEKRNQKVIGFGKKGAEFRLKNLTPLPHGQHAELALFGKDYALEIPLVGAFQAMNILAALGLVIGTGGELEKALAVVPKFAGVPGRLEQVVRLANGATVFIDYAHTPMALANILNTLRPHTQNKLHVVFGCGGDRDAGKRPEMGRFAAQLADEVIVTDDNPRSENSASIRAAIMVAAGRAKEIADRREAIYAALKNLAAGDMLVIAGKGHEKYQIVGDKTFPFDDAEVARAAAKELA